MAKVFSVIEKRPDVYPHIAQNIEIIDLINIAFERNKWKSPSEVDLAIFGMLYNRYKGNPPPGALEEIREILECLAYERGKPNPKDYVRRTELKAIDYWLELKRKRERERDNDFGPEL